MAYDLIAVEDAYVALTTLMKTDLDEQFAKKRIKGTEYADTYQRLMNTCIDLAFKAPAIDKDLTLKEKELEKMECELQNCAQNNLFLQAKTALTIAQVDLAVKDLILKDKELDLADAKISNAEKDLLVKDAQIAVSKRQEEGFDEDIQRKMLEVQMNSWSLMFSSGLLEEVPTIISNDSVSTLYNFMSNNAGVPTI